MSSLQNFLQEPERCRSIADAEFDVMKAMFQYAEAIHMDLLDPHDPTRHVDAEREFTQALARFEAVCREHPL